MTPHIWNCSSKLNSMSSWCYKTKIRWNIMISLATSTTIFRLNALKTLHSITPLHLNETLKWCADCKSNNSNSERYTLELSVLYESDFAFRWNGAFSRSGTCSKSSTTTRVPQISTRPFFRLLVQGVRLPRRETERWFHGAAEQTHKSTHLSNGDLLVVGYFLPLYLRVFTFFTIFTKLFLQP